jgi:hypothetical protein
MAHIPHHGSGAGDDGNHLREDVEEIFQLSGFLQLFITEK